MVRPQQNLPGESQQWARSVEGDIDRLLRAQDDRGRTLNSTLSGLANSVTNLGLLVKTLSEQQVQLTEQQEQLTAQVAQINELVNSQIITSDFDARGPGFGAGTGWTSLATANVVVPAGYTKALVFANAWWYMSDFTITVTSLLSGRGVINGITTPSNVKQVNANNVAQGDISGTQRLTGLTPGTSFNVTVQIQSPAGVVSDADNNSRIYGSVLWLR